jgi:hypothetical protein
MSESIISPEKVTEELQKLYQLFQNGAITSTEYAQAKAKVLAVDSESTAQSMSRDHGQSQIQLLRLEMQNALISADHNWEYERERHLIYPKDGRPYEPAKSDWLVSMLLNLLPIIGLITAGKDPNLFKDPKILSLILGLSAIFLAFAMGGAISAYSRFRRFKSAQEEYLNIRSNIQAQYEQRIQELQSQ